MEQREEQLLAALADAVERYRQRNPRSAALHAEALDSLPGGNTRTLLYQPPFPVFISRGEGHLLFDEDGHEYVDLVGEMTAGLFGHSRPELVGAVAETAARVGLSLGATTAAEARLARLLCERFGLGHVRFTNSGTEANLHALAAARRHTGRRRVIVFSAAYHGSVLSFGQPVKEVDGGEVGYAGAENNVDPDCFVVLRYNDCHAVRQAFREHGAQVAAVLVEGMQGSAGFIPGTYKFLLTIQEECEKAGSVFILDEVMTSRLAAGGLQSTFTDPSCGGDAARTPIRPTLTTLGKYVGGGLPFGAFGGARDVMAVYDPRRAGALAHSGTFQNNTLMLHAAHAAMSRVYTPARAAEHSARGEAFRARLRDAVRGSRLAFTGIGSLVCLHASERWGRVAGAEGGAGGLVSCREEGDPEDGDLKTLFWLYMLDKGFWVNLRGNIALILDIPQEALDRFVAAVGDFVKQHESVLKL